MGNFSFAVYVSNKVFESMSFVGGFQRGRGCGIVKWVKGVYCMVMDGN